MGEWCYNFPHMDYAWVILSAAAVGAGFWYWNRRRGSGESAFVFEEYVRDLTALAAAGKLDPVIGRDKEIERVIEIVLRRLKNNPLLIGEPGVGKTAVAEGLAQRIADRKVPEKLLGVRLLALNLPDMLAGTAFRGELENRIKKFTEQIEAFPGRMVLFIDEIHMIHQVKGVQGGLNLSDMLKPALARGEISVLGATTWKEFRDSLRTDPAIERRFQPVLIGEPSREDAIEILRHLKPEYERFHKVEISDEAIIAAVDSSAEFIKDRFLPDKAFDLIDEASARVSLDGTLTHKAPMGVLDRAASATLEEFAAERQELTEEIEHLDRINKEHPNDADVTAAERLLKHHVEDLRADEEIVRSGKRPTVEPKHVLKVIAAWRRYLDSQSKKE